MLILNATGRNSSDEVRKEGVIDLPNKTRGLVKDWMSCEGLKVMPPSQSSLMYNAERFVDEIEIFVKGMEDRTGVNITHVLIDPCPYLASHLEKALHSLGLTPMYAHYTRLKTTGRDGKTKTVKVFSGFIEA